MQSRLWPKGRKMSSVTADERIREVIDALSIQNTYRRNKDCCANGRKTNCFTNLRRKAV